jgi:hypothetical protein
VHVIARDRQVAEALTAQGFRPGLLPLRPSIGPMHALVPLLLEAFSYDEH